MMNSLMSSFGSGVLEGGYTRAVTVAVRKCIVVGNVGGGVLVSTSLASMIRRRKVGLEELEKLDLRVYFMLPSING